MAYTLISLAINEAFQRQKKPYSIQGILFYLLFNVKH